VPVPTLTRSGAPVVGPAGTGRPGEGVNVQKLSLRGAGSRTIGPAVGWPGGSGGYAQKIAT
jgi:hypothetical protein